MVVDTPAVVEDMAVDVEEAVDMEVADVAVVVADTTTDINLSFNYLILCCK